ncbi:MAG: hypothetical protein WB608_24910 [Terracidiphilus sp.]
MVPEEGGEKPEYGEEGSPEEESGETGVEMCREHGIIQTFTFGEEKKRLDRLHRGLFVFAKTRAFKDVLLRP